MSKMTSSLHADNLAKRRRQAAAAAALVAARSSHRDSRQQQLIEGRTRTAACNGAGGNKVLTDFSIDSIIGSEGGELAGPELQGERTRGDAIVAGQRSRERAPATCCAPRAAARIEPAQIGFIRPTAQEDLFQQQQRQQFMLSKMDQHEQYPAAASKKPRPKLFRCAGCTLSFSNKGQLRNHERIHTGERPFGCEFRSCARTFTRNEELTRHKLIHTGVRPHACSHCDKRFGRKDHLKKHERTHERKKLSRRAQALRTSPLVRANNVVDVFLPLKQEQMVPIREPLPFHLTSTSTHPPPPPPTDPPMHFYPPITTNTSSDFTAGLLSSQIASLAAAVVATSTATTTATQAGLPTIMSTTPLAVPSQAITSSANSPIHQLASNYWQQWCNLLEQQTHQQQFYQSLNN